MFFLSYRYFYLISNFISRYRRIYGVIDFLIVKLNSATTDHPAKLTFGANYSYAYGGT